MIRHAKELLKSLRVDFIYFLETHMTYSRKLLKMANRLSYDSNFTIELLGFIRYLTLLWNPGSINLQVMSSISQVIHTIVNGQHTPIRVSFMQVRPNTMAKEHFFGKSAILILKLMMSLGFFWGFQ